MIIDPQTKTRPLSVGARRYAVRLAASSMASRGLHGPGPLSFFTTPDIMDRNALF